MASTLNVAGNIIFASGSTFQVEVNAAGKSDKILATGTATLNGGTVQVLAATGNYKPSTKYTILTAQSGVTGMFTGATSNFAFLDPSLLYNANNVFLVLERIAVDFCSVTETRNQCNVADALEQFPTGNPLFLAVLNQTASGARTAFDALSGELHATLSGILVDESRYVREAILGRLMQASHTRGGNQVAALGAGGPRVASLDSSAMALGSPLAGGKSFDAPPPYGPGLTFWTQGFGAWADFDGNRNAAEADRDLGGFVSGMDANVGGSWRLGVATGFSRSDVSVDARHSSAEVESYHLAAYAGGELGPLALRTGGAWSWNDIDTSRAVLFPGFFEWEKASYDGDTGQVFAEVAYPLVLGSVAVEPFAGLAYVNASTDSFRERGGVAALKASGIDNDVTYSTLGVRAATTMQLSTMMVTSRISLAWQHAFDDVTPGAALAFVSTGIGFTVTGVPLAQDSLLVEAGLDFNLGPNATLGVSYSGQLASDLQDNAVKGRLTWLF
jgi:outer membrane autotransporter protein